MKFIVNITLKKGVLDPQGLAIKNSLATSGFFNINEVKPVSYTHLTLPTKA